jgi:methyl-accepting chemotaxis protein
MVAESGTEQVSQSMDEIQQFTQHALEGSKQVKSTADGLVMNAQDLTTVLEKTRALIGAQKSSGSDE